MANYKIAVLFYVFHFCRCVVALDFRYVQGTSLQESVQKFSQSGVEKFTELLFDVPHYQLIVGSRDYLFRLTLDGLRKLEEAHWPAPAETIKTCRQKGQSEADCRNFVKVLLNYNNKIFTCGTNAFSPECSWREVNSLNSVSKWESGFTRCPYNPHYNSTALMTINGDYYIASALDFGATDHAIYRISNKSSNLRTIQYDYKWLKAPDFVGSFEISNFTYFFFREEAVEYNNCGKVIYSRVGRMCKSDKGGRYVLKDKWTTFLKARLNCSTPGPYPFYYDEIQSVHYMEQEQMIYATFNTPGNSIYGTAICAFNLTSIARAFDGPFKYQENPKASWEKATVSHKHFQCETNGDQETEMDSQKYQLMNDLVQPVYQQPVYTSELERFGHIAVDVVATKHHDGVHVVFVATLEGVLRKLSVLPRTFKACLVEEIHLFPENSSTTIHSIKLSKDMNSLYLGTDKEVIRVLTQRCKRFKTKAACLNAMDPYCGWHEHQLACTTAPYRNPKLSTWKQDLLDCPKVELPSDGGWTSWSKWTECSQTGLNTAGDRCLCHTRTCTNPTPTRGGKPCTGETMEVSNCTRNGLWTEWSAWSSCSSTCGPAVKTRRRVCGNPSPAFGGRICIGPERDEIYCTSNPPCPAANRIEPVDGAWSEWGDWGNCSAQCGGGMHNRRRKCSNPSPAHGGRDCMGTPQEFRMCNQHKCSEVRKTTPWTPWLKANSTRDGHFEQRHRFIFKVNAPDASMIRIGAAKKEERFCLEGSTSCLDAAFVNIDGEWSEWQTWSKCTVPCDGGTQYRERSCDNPRPSGNGADCQGEARQEQECNMHSCEAVDGWKEWSVWSICDSTNEQRRQRNCIYTAPTVTHCQGSSKESRLCVTTQIAAAAEESKSVSKSGLDLGLVALVAIASFLLGTPIGAIGRHAYSRYKRRSKGNRLSGLNLRKSSELNFYCGDKGTKQNNLEEQLAKLTLRESTPMRDVATIKRQTSLRTKMDDPLFSI